MEKEEAKKKLEGLLDSFKKEAIPSPFKFFDSTSKESVQPAGETGGPAPTGAAAADPQMKIRELEAKLQKEREKSMTAEVTLKEREIIRLEMEEMFKSLRD